MDCYFYAKLHGFHRAKELAIGYRQRLEQEWAEAEAGWAVIDAEKEKARQLAREERVLIQQLEQQQQTRLE